MTITESDLANALAQEVGDRGVPMSITEKIGGMLVSTLIALVLGAGLGVSLSTARIRREAIDAGVAHYVLINPDTGEIEFQWIVPPQTEGKAE